MDAKRKRIPIGAWLIAGVAFVPVAYILSLGPTIWLLNRNPRISASCQDAFHVYFAPSNWLAAALPAPLLDALTWYIRLWA